MRAALELLMVAALLYLLLAPMEVTVECEDEGFMPLIVDASTDL